MGKRIVFFWLGTDTCKRHYKDFSLPLHFPPHHFFPSFCFHFRPALWFSSLLYAYNLISGYRLELFVPNVTRWVLPAPTILFYVLHF